MTIKNLISFFLFFSAFSARPQSPRTDILLDSHWRTIATDSNLHALPHFEDKAFSDAAWKTVDIPHNWDDYDGYRRLRHGNRHGTAWYRKTFVFKAPARHAKPVDGHPQPEGRFFLFFEGVGSYATVWLNGRKAGYHAGGRTTFTLDVTGLLYSDGRSNLLAVQADHPAFIKDLPWVCGGCSDERGFSEGSQPMGIFRPVHLIATNDVRIDPFGVHVWNDTTVSATSASVFVETAMTSYRDKTVVVGLRTSLLDHKGTALVTQTVRQTLRAGTHDTVTSHLPAIPHPRLWSPADPYRYILVSEIFIDGRLVDRITTPYGIRTISWPVGQKAGGPFLINGKPFFINGIAEYEHLLGGSHAFTEEQVRDRVSMIKAAGFNAFRDAHQPHNLRYQQYWDREGLLWWPQLSAHIWFDTPAFKENFLRLLRDWVRERRNSPSLVLWGLQNESKLPAAFAAECSDIIRRMDPTASTQRKITTCNGGEGTDWDVPQNWTGTYGGNPATYAADLQKQILVGEYGGWRTLGLHDNDPAAQSTLRSEDNLAQLMETKIRLADGVKDKVAGHFFWLLTSHDNPGRVQGGEGWREMDRVGPVNYKGLFTPWEEPTDVFYMFRSNFVSAKKDPMVYIVSHTNPDRWTKPVDHDSIIVYSNCDEVELFNDIDSLSLGKRKRGGTGTHFQWNDVPVKYNILYAKGYVNGRLVAKDTVLLHWLDQSPHYYDCMPSCLETMRQLLAPKPGYHYIYRVNCGGDAYVDINANEWLADCFRRGGNTWGSSSWADRFPGLLPYFASQRTTSDYIKGTIDWSLFQTFRYGRQELKYIFPLPDGDYRVELYFIEPWINWPGGVGERLFDVAVNHTTVLHNLDIYKEAGHDRVLKKVVNIHITGGRLVLSFPRVAAGQALISAIAVASRKRVSPAPAALPLLALAGDKTVYRVHQWMNTGEHPFPLVDVFSQLPPVLYGADWLRREPFPRPAERHPLQLRVNAPARLFAAVDTSQSKPAWIKDYTDTKTFIKTALPDRCYRVWTRDVDPSMKIVIGDDSVGIRGCIIGATPATTIEPAYDLKPTATYKAVNASASPGIAKETVNGKPALVFKQPAGDTLQWSIHTGVADIYSLAIRYAQTTSDTLAARLQLVDENNRLLHEETVRLPPSPPGKWSYLNSSTATMINAGSYRLRLININAPGLAIDALDVQ